MHENAHVLNARSHRLFLVCAFFVSCCCLRRSLPGGKVRRRRRLFRLFRLLCLAITAQLTLCHDDSPIFAQPRVRLRYPVILCAFIAAVAIYFLVPAIFSGRLAAVNSALPCRLRSAFVQSATRPTLPGLWRRQRRGPEIDSLTLRGGRHASARGSSHGIRATQPHAQERVLFQPWIFHEYASRCPGIPRSGIEKTVAQWTFPPSAAPSPLHHDLVCVSSALRASSIQSLRLPTISRSGSARLHTARII